MNDASLNFSQNEQIRILFENALDAVVGMNAKGKIIDWNQQAEQTFGWTRAEALGLSMSETIIPRVHRGNHERGLKNFMSSGHGPVLNTRLELSAMRKDGSEIPIELSVTPINGNGTCVFYAFLRDISDRKMAAQRLEEAVTRAEAANQAKSDFLANMSHEIRTPLGAVLGFSDLVADPLITTEDRLTYIEAIHRNGKLLSNLIDDILDLSKVEAGKVQIETQRIEIQTLIDDLSPVFEMKARAKGIDFGISIAPDVPPIIHSDPTRLRQILFNIVGNAIKFTAQGSVTVGIQMLPVAQPDGNQTALKIAFNVQDTGPGIDKDHLMSLFQSFSQADSSIRRRYGGTGLGLVLSRGLSEMLGGTVQLVKSQLGCGSHFQIVIDASRPLTTTYSDADNLKIDRSSLIENGVETGQGQRQDQESASGRLRGLLILITDDSQDNQLLISRILSSAGAEFQFAANGFEALNSTEKSNFDLVLMDLQMPELDGFEATRRLRERGFRQPIVALTAHALQHERERCLANGFDDHFTKPIHREKLIAMIATLCQPLASEVRRMPPSAP